jgi:hypothetical protein
MATSAQSSCHLTLLKTIDNMANSFSYRDLMIDGLYGTKVLISPALMGRDELSGSIFGQHFMLVTSPDTDGPSFHLIEAQLSYLQLPCEV